MLEYLTVHAPEDLQAYYVLLKDVKYHYGEDSVLKYSWDSVISHVFTEKEKSPHYPFLKKYFSYNELKLTDIKAQMNDMLAKTKRLAKNNPIQAAAYFHMRLVNIHPWADGNGRVARLGANLLLIKGEYPAIAFTSDERYTKAIAAFNKGDKKAFEVYLEEEICRTTGLFDNPAFKEGKPFEELVKNCKIEGCDQEFEKLVKQFGL